MVAGRTLTGVRVRNALAVAIFAAGLLGLLATAIYLHHVLTAYPASPISGYGLGVPAIGSAHAAWLRYAPSGLAIAGFASIVALLVARRMLGSAEARIFAMALIGALDLFLALCGAMSLLLAFHLPTLVHAF